jgi:hypothetical protein
MRPPASARLRTVPPMKGDSETEAVPGAMLEANFSNASAERPFPITVTFGATNCLALKASTSLASSLLRSRAKGLEPRALPSP